MSMHVQEGHYSETQHFANRMPKDDLPAEFVEHFRIPMLSVSQLQHHVAWSSWQVLMQETTDM